MFGTHRKEGRAATARKEPQEHKALPPGRPPVLSSSVKRVPPVRRALPSRSQHLQGFRKAQQQALRPLRAGLPGRAALTLPRAARPPAVKARVPRAKLPRLETAKKPVLKLPTLKQPALKSAARTSFAQTRLDAASLKKAGVSVRKARQQAALRRRKAGQLASRFLTWNRTRVRTIGQQARKLTAQIQGGARKATARVMAAATRNQGAIRAAFAGQRARVNVRSAAASAQLSARHAAVLASLPAATNRARAASRQAHTAALQGARTSADAQKTSVRAAYEALKPQYVQAGEATGQKALERAETQARSYESNVTGQDDSLLDGPLTDNRWKARAQAARDVGKAYQPGFRDQADTEAQKLTGPDGGLSKDLANIDASLAETEKQLRAQLDAGNQRLQAQEARARQQAMRAYTGLNAALRSQLAATLGQLSQTESAQIGAIVQQAQAQSRGLQQQATTSSAGLHRSVTQIARQIDQSLGAFDRQVRAAQAPDPKQLQAALTRAQQSITGSVHRAQGQLGQAATRVTAGLSQGAAKAETGFGSLTRNAVGQGSQIGGGFDRGAQGIVTQALALFTQLQTGHQQGATRDSQAIGKTLEQLGKGLENLYAKVLKGLPAELQATLPPLRTALEGNFPQEDASIRENAEAAAAQVQPRWKSFVKIALVIAVIIVVAVVAGPAVIGAVGAMAGALGAGAAAGAIGTVVGGAIVGAASGAVIQMGNNAIDNVGMDAKFQKSIFDGVGKAALIGAVGGALGGAGGLIAGKMGTAGLLGSGLTQKAGVFGVSTGFDLGGNVLGDMMNGASLGDALKNLTNPEVLMMMAIGTGVGAATTRLPGRTGQVQTRAHEAGTVAGTRAGDHVNNVTGNRRGVMPTRENTALPDNTTSIGGFQQRRTAVAHSSTSHPNDIQIHQKHAVDARADVSVPGKLKNGAQRLLNDDVTKVGSRRWELEIEARKHADMAAWREAEAARLPRNDPDALRLRKEARELRLREAEYLNHSRNTPDEPGTGVIEHADFPNLTKQEYDAFRNRIDNASLDEAWKIRYERYQLNKTKGTPPQSPEDYGAWLPKAQRAHANLTKGIAEENAALSAARMDNNNYNTTSAGEPRTPVKYTTTIDGTEITVRPDAVSDTVWVDVKALSDGVDVQYFTRQLRAEYEGALSQGKKLMVILSSASAEVRPSSSLAGADDVVVLRRNPEATGEEWAVWQTSETGDGKWEGVSVDDVRAFAGSGEVNPTQLEGK